MELKVKFPSKNDICRVETNEESILGIFTGKVIKESNQEPVAEFITSKGIKLIPWSNAVSFYKILLND